MNAYRYIVHGLITAMLVTVLMADGQPLSDVPVNPEHLLKGFVHPPVVVIPGSEYGPRVRNYQGIPSVERAANGRLWAAWYAGKIWEERFNYVVLSTSSDNGTTWNDASIVIDPDGDGPYRACDPCLWLAPDGRLWCFWWMNEKVWSGNGESKLSVTMAMTTDNPDAEKPTWNKPTPIFPGLMLNKPIVTKRGEWLMPSNKWFIDDGLRVMVSRDKGKSWALRGTANVPQAKRNSDEPMLVERNDGSLWMLVRTSSGIGESVSRDDGRTWTEVSDYQQHTVSRFNMRRLQSGNLLMIRNGPINTKGERDQLTAFLSKNDGRTWEGGLILDERKQTSYPDTKQAADGTIYAIYDFNRHLEKQILMAKFTEDDILAQSPVGVAPRLKINVNQAFGENPVVGRIADGPSPRTDTTAVDLMVAKAHPGIRCITGEARPLHRTEEAFSDSDYIIKSLPTGKLSDHGMNYVFTSIRGAEIVCTSPGILYVFTPTRDRNPLSVEPELLDRGFRKTSAPEFDLLFKVNEKARNSNLCSVFQKEVKTGEVIKVGSWGIVAY
jgi:hypothetical protein